MSEIIVLSYDAGGALTLKMFDPKANTTSDITAVDVEPTNMLAVDSAFERRTPVQIHVDDHKHILRVETLAPAPNEPESGPMTPGLVITRIASQRQENLIAEIFVPIDPNHPNHGEKPVRTTDPLIHIICHGAFLSKRPVDIKWDQTDDITRVAKQRLDPPPR